MSKRGIYGEIEYYLPGEYAMLAHTSLDRPFLLFKILDCYLWWYRG